MKNSGQCTSHKALAKGGCGNGLMSTTLGRQLNKKCNARIHRDFYHFKIGSKITLSRKKSKNTSVFRRDL